MDSFREKNMNIIIAMILMFKGGNDYLKVINKYYPAVMREYNNSEDSIDIKLENLEKKLLELKESSPAIVVDAIMKRETIKLIWPFHTEMVFLVIMIFWGTNYTWREESRPIALNQNQYDAFLIFISM